MNQQILHYQRIYLRSADRISSKQQHHDKLMEISRSSSSKFFSIGQYDSILEMFHIRSKWELDLGTDIAEMARMIEDQNRRLLKKIILFQYMGNC